MKKLAVIVLLTLCSLSNVQAKSQHRRPKVSAEKFAQKIFKKMLKKRKFKLAKDESTSLKFDSEEFTYSKKLTFKTKRGYFCQG